MVNAGSAFHCGPRGDLLNASVLSDDPAVNLQLGLGVELAVLPPYLYALWSIKPSADGASDAAVEAARTIRAVAYEEMLHAALVGNVLNALGAPPRVTRFLMTYPGPLPGHTTKPPYAYDVGLGPLSPATVETFMRIELPEWDEVKAPSPDANGRWITIGQFYDTVEEQLRELGAGAFRNGRQLPLGDNPGPGRLVDVVDLPSALEAIATIVDQGEGHKPKSLNPSDRPSSEDDDDHEVAHYYQFKTIATYFKTRLLDAERDVYPVISNPDAARYTPEQQAANTQFNTVYTALLNSLQTMFTSDSPRAFGEPAKLMTQLTHLAAVLRGCGDVPGTAFVAGPTFEYLGAPSGGRP
jgi:hypothetical protein